MQLTVTGSVFPSANRSAKEADHLLPPSADVKQRVDFYLHSPYALLANTSYIIIIIIIIIIIMKIKLILLS
jgi:hypothetical protein